MREAIARAEVGDEQKREDPTVNELEQRVAALVGQEEAVFLPTATMANQIALRVLSEPGDELLADAWSHLFINELGGPAVHSGLVMRPLESTDGRFTADQVRDAVWDRRDTHRPITRLVSIENTNNSAGGRIWPVDEIAALKEKGVGVSNTVHPTKLRAVTHLDVSDEDIEQAVELAPEALAAHV